MLYVRLFIVFEVIAAYKLRNSVFSYLSNSNIPTEPISHVTIVYHFYWVDAGFVVKKAFQARVEDKQVWCLIKLIDEYFMLFYLKRIKANWIFGINVWKGQTKIEMDLFGICSRWAKSMVSPFVNVYFYFIDDIELKYLKAGWMYKVYVSWVRFIDHKQLMRCEREYFALEILRWCGSSQEVLIRFG